MLMPCDYNNNNNNNNNNCNWVVTRWQWLFYMDQKKKKKKKETSDVAELKSFETLPNQICISKETMRQIKCGESATIRCRISKYKEM